MGKKLTNEEFIKKSKEVHGDKYDYSKVEYINNSTKVCIICPKHGEFWQVPNSHLNGNGCPQCSGVKRLTKMVFLARANEMHNSKYKYYDDFIGIHHKIKINCPIHGDFIQLAKHHLKGQGCPECGKKYAQECKKNHYDDFIKCSKERFGNAYDFPNIEEEFENTHSIIHFKCLKCGRVFTKRANDHITSKNGGCNCMNGNKSCLEKDVENMLVENKISFKEEKSFPWLKLKRLDFYLPQYNIAIECQGIQHFKPSSRFGGEKEFIKQIKRDEEKFDECSKHGINILYYTNQKVESKQYKLLYTIEELLEEIKKWK